MRIPRRLRWIAVGLLALLILGGAALALAASVPDDHSAFREGRSDLRELRDDLVVAGYGVGALAASPLALADAADPKGTLVVVAGVERPYRETEADALVRFVEAGGRLVLADDSGNGEELARRFGVHISAIPVFDDRYETNVSLVNVTATVTRRAGEPRLYSPLVMNVPTSLTPEDAAKGVVLASTTDRSFGDLVPNRKRDPGDLKGPFIVAFETTYGKGRVVVLSDPDVFGSALLANRAYANRAFANDLFLSLLPDGGNVLFDESRHGAPIVESAGARSLGLLVTATKDPWMRFVSVAVAVVAGLLLVALVPAEEALGHHVGGLDKPSKVELDKPLARLVRAARTRIRLVHRARAEDDPAKLATDPVLAALVASENALSPDKDLRDIVQRVRSYGASQRAQRGPP